MAGKRAGSLSGSMISRREKREDVGFIIKDAKLEPKSSEPAEEEHLALGAANATPAPLDASSSDSPSPPTADASVGDQPTVDQPATTHEVGPRVKDRLSLKDQESATLVVSRIQGSAQSADVVHLYPDDQSSGRVEGLLEPGEGGERLVRALREADIAEAEEIFALMTGLGHMTVLRLLYGLDGRDLAVACKALGMEQLQFVSVYILSRKLGLGEETLDSRDLARVVSFFENCDETEAIACLSAWRVSEQHDTGRPLSPT